MSLYTAQPEELRLRLEAMEEISEYLEHIEYIAESGVAVPANPVDEDHPVVTSYAKDMDISYAEAERRLTIQVEMDVLGRKIAEGEATYAGSWILHQPEFGLIAAFAAPDGDEKIAPYLDGVSWRDLVQVWQAPFTVSELEEIQGRINRAAEETKIPFESGIVYHIGKVNIYTPQPEELRSQLEANDDIKQYVEHILFTQQESLSVPAALKYPSLLGGHAISTCTTGFVVKRNSDGRRFMSTAGHCSNTQSVVYNGSSSVYLGPVVFENDPVANVGPFGDDMDVQMHDAGVRSFDLTNVIWESSVSSVSIVGTIPESNQLNKYVCKFGKTTGRTCGNVTSVNYKPGDDFTSATYVRVDRDAGAGDIGCPGDSGSPVFHYSAGATLAMGILSGIERHDPECVGNTSYFTYTPVDEISRAGFSILTAHYQQRYHLNVWTGTSCTEYITPVDEYGNLLYSQQTSQPCSTSLPAGSSGTVQSYNAYIVGQNWREGMWRGGIGYVRNVPLNSNGTINWGSAPPGWSLCCSGGTAPLAQEGKIVGNHFYLNVFEPGGTCTEYKTPLNNNGDLVWASQTTQSCRTSAPGSGTVQSYNIYVLGENWREGIWRNSLGYVRTTPLNSTNTDINYGASWSGCCSGATVPDSQGGDILTYP